jgi:hypothetical protein
VTLPLFRQRVQTYARFGVPSTTMRTRWRFGSKRRLVATIEWLRWWPNEGFFPQTEQILDIAARKFSYPRATAVRSCENASAISSAARAAQAPRSTRASACSAVSHVSSPKETGTPVSIPAS